MLFDIGNLPWLLAAAGALWIVSIIIAGFIRERNIRRLGGHAPIYKTKYPLSLDFMSDGIKYAYRDDNLKFWHRNFMGGNANAQYPYTVESDPGGERIVFTADPENIKAILASQFNDFGKGEMFNLSWKEFLGDSIFSTDGKLWHDSRQLIRPQFIKDRVSDLVTFERHAQALIPKLGGNGKPVDVKDLFFRLTLDAATDFLLGHNVDSMHQEHNEFAEAFGRVQHIQTMIFRTGPFWRLYPRREFRKNLKIVNDFVETFVDRALALSPEELAKRSKSDEGYTFLHAIASYTRDRKVLRDQVVAVFLAGRDTTACTLSWMFYELSRQPDLVADLRREIGETVGWERPPTYADLKGMKLVQHCMSETLRLYPVVPYNVRLALRDTTLPRGGGPLGQDPIGVLKDTPIGYSTQYMQLTPDIYPPISAKFPPAHEFAPRRWEHWQPKPWTYIPFNGGPRICVGQQFALTEMSYTLVRVLQHFSRFEPVPAPGAEASKEAHGLDGGFAGQGGASAETSSNKNFPWARKDAGPSLVEASAERTLPQRSEIVLSPAVPVWLGFWQ